METTTPWRELLKHPCGGDHFVQVYQDEQFLAEAVAEYIGTALREGEAVILIATPAHRRAFLRNLGASGLFPEEAIKRGQLRLLDGAETLAKFMRDGMPEWPLFHQTVGGALAELRLQISDGAGLWPPTQMPLGQATLFWLKKNMPRTADKVLTQVPAQLA